MLKAYVRTERQLISPTGAVRTAAVTYYATSLDPIDADRIADCARRRWGIETKLHYVLDVIFDEDDSRASDTPPKTSRVRAISRSTFSV